MIGCLKAICFYDTFFLNLQKLVTTATKSRAIDISSWKAEAGIILQPCFPWLHAEEK